MLCTERTQRQHIARQAHHYTANTNKYHTNVDWLMTNHFTVNGVLDYLYTIFFPLQSLTLFGTIALPGPCSFASLSHSLLISQKASRIYCMAPRIALARIFGFTSLSDKSDHSLISLIAGHLHCVPCTLTNRVNCH